MINKILPKSNNELLCWKAFVSALTSYYYGEDLADENRKKLFNFVRHELQKATSQDAELRLCEFDWGDDLLQLNVDVSNLSTTMKNFWYCIFGIVVDSSYLGRNYREFSNNLYFEILENSIEESVREFILEDWEPSEEDILFIEEIVK